jgi:hypothetical protein
MINTEDVEESAQLDGCSSRGEEQYEYKEHNCRLYSISSCMDCIMDEEAHPVCTLVVKSGLRGLPLCAKAPGEVKFSESEALLCAFDRICLSVTGRRR